MTLRTGLSNLVKKMRALTNAGTADFTLAGETYFTDDHMQDILDANVYHVEDQELLWLPDTIGGGSITYQRASLGYRDFEELSSGTAYWIIRDSVGTEIGTSTYTVNYIDGIVRFTGDQAGSAYYLTARCYDIYAAAADVWLRIQSYYSDWFRFSTRGQAFERQQAYEHAVQQEKIMRQRAGKHIDGGDMHTSSFARSDVWPS